MKRANGLLNTKIHIIIILLFVCNTVTFADDAAFYSLHVDKQCDSQENEYLYLPGVSELFIPQGALDEDMQIGMTVNFWWAKDDPDFFIEFSPHGTVFNMPIRLTL